MKFQIISLSKSHVFDFYEKKYRINNDYFRINTFGLEIRDLSDKEYALLRNSLKLSHKAYYREIDTDNPHPSLLVVGFIHELEDTSRKIIATGVEEIGINMINAVKNFKDYDDNKSIIGEKEFKFDKCYIMGILNVTPDSFSDKGAFRNPKDALKHVSKMIEEGADIIDIGGESTRPGSKPVSADEELERVIPVIETVLSKHPGFIFSIDTTKSKVAEEALKRGIKIVNDISGGTFDPEIVNVTAEFNAAFVCMHTSGQPLEMQQKTEYNNLIADIYDHLLIQTDLLKSNGVKNIFIDPGVGFGKTMEDNLVLLDRLSDFKSLGYPILLGLSKKSFLGKLFNQEIEQREISTVIAETLAIQNGARIIRTHNVGNCIQAVKLINSMNKA